MGSPGRVVGSRGRVVGCRGRVVGSRGRVVGSRGALAWSTRRHRFCTRRLTRCHRRLRFCRGRATSCRGRLTFAAPSREFCRGRLRSWNGRLPLCNVRIFCRRRGAEARPLIAREALRSNRCTASDVGEHSSLLSGSAEREMASGRAMPPCSPQPRGGKSATAA